MVRILLVEGNDVTRRLWHDILSDGGYEVITASNGAKALEILEHSYIDLIVTDIMMPDTDGFELMEQLHEAKYTIPIIVVTARAAQEDKKRCFLLGADDYITKPVDEEEMLLRIASLLRRAKITSQRKLVIGGTELLYDSMQVNCDNNSLFLPKKEFLLLYKLLSFPNRIFTRRQLMDEIWGFDSYSDEHTVNVHINRLREKFKDNPDFRIVTMRGLGYKAVKK